MSLNSMELIPRPCKSMSHTTEASQIPYIGVSQKGGWGKGGLATASDLNTSYKFSALRGLFFTSWFSKVCILKQYLTLGIWSKTLRIFCHSWFDFSWFVP